MDGEKVLTMDEVSKLSSQEIGDAEEKVIADEARKEYEIESGKREPEEKPEPKEPEKKEEAKEDEETPEAKAEREDKEAKKAEAKAAKEAKEAEDKKKDDERILAAKDEELKDEEKARKAELVKIREEAEAKVEEEITKKFAERNKIPIEDARKERASIKKLYKETYKGDIEEVLNGYWNIQRAFGRSQEEIKAMREAAPIRAIERMSDNEVIESFIDSGKIKIKGKALTREEALTQYRESKQKQTENADDEAVLAMIASDIRREAMMKQKENIVNAKVAAKDKRDEVVAGLSETDKKYTDEIREILNAMPDNAVLAEGFSSQDILLWAKGKRVEEIESTLKDEVKKSYDEGYKKGKEEAKILGVKQETKPSGQPQKKTPTLSEREKKEALDMFDTDSMTEDEKIAAYVEVMKKKEK